MSRLLREHRAGWVVPPGDGAALATALAEALEGPEADHEARRAGARELLAAFQWERALEPLLRFCRAPRADAAKDRFACGPALSVPRDALAFRVRRKLRRTLGRLGL